MNDICLIEPCLTFFVQDEVFHIPQAQRFCSGHFGDYDAKITTFPGLYVA